MTIAASVIVAYYAFCLFEKAQAWWRRESLDHKFVVIPARLKISRRSEVDADVFVEFLIKNEATVDVAYVLDDEDFAVGEIHAEATAAMPPRVLRPDQSLGQVSGCIRRVPIGQHVWVPCKTTFRYGREMRRLNIRLFSTFSLRLPDNIAKPGAESAEGSHTESRNDYEWISTN